MSDVILLEFNRQVAQALNAAAQKARGLCRSPRGEGLRSSTLLMFRA